MVQMFYVLRRVHRDKQNFDFIIKILAKNEPPVGKELYLIVLVAMNKAKYGLSSKTQVPLVLIEEKWK